MYVKENQIKLDIDTLVLPTVQQDLKIRELNALHWLNDLPAKAKACCEEWNLTPIEVLYGGRSGCVIKVREKSMYGPGPLRVLKFALTSARAAQEAAALQCFQSGGATPEVFKVDVEKAAILMDWVETYVTLRTTRNTTSLTLPNPKEFQLMGDLLLKLKKSNKVDKNNAQLMNVPTLEAFHRERLSAAGALKEVARGTRPPTPANLGRAIATLDFLVASNSFANNTLIHGDLNSGNVLGGENPLKAIDPRPLRGAPEYDTAVFALKTGEKNAEKTARILASVTGEDVEQVLCWLFIARVSRV